VPRRLAALAVPRIGVPFYESSDLPDAVRGAAGEPVLLRLPTGRPAGGVALAREWAADLVEVSCSGTDLDALLLHADTPEHIAGMLVAALRLNLPTVCAPPASQSFSAAFVALGLTPSVGEPMDTIVSLAGRDGLRPRGLVDNFSLANALKAGVAAGGDALHDVPTVAGNLKENLPPAPPPPDEHARLAFVRARTSGAEAVCRVREGVTEAAGECLVFGSEEAAVSGVRRGLAWEGSLLVVCGCGPRGGPGLLRLDALGRSLREAGLEVPVLTDGLAPRSASGTWISLFTPEAVAGGVLGLLRDGDPLRIDLAEGRIRTGIGAREFENRESAEFPDRAGTGYAARYTRTALPALEGAGFG
jgi:dihydroxy-acid dehydratase